MIVVDMNGNHYTNDEGAQCVEYYLNTEVDGKYSSTKFGG